MSLSSHQRSTDRENVFLCLHVSRPWESVQLPYELKLYTITLLVVIFRRILIKLKNMQLLSLQVKLTVKLIKSLSTKAKDEKKAQSVFSLTIWKCTNNKKCTDKSCADANLNSNFKLFYSWPKHWICNMRLYMLQGCTFSQLCKDKKLCSLLVL